jgi:hypothetical protein
VRDRRLVDLDRREPALERSVLLQVLAVLVQRRGTDGLQLAAGQHRLQDRGSVDGALGGTGTHQGVELVDEQDDVAPGADLLQHLLEALLEVASVPGACDQRAQIERVELLALQRLGHVVGDDALRQALDDGGLADTGLADQHRVVLGAPGQHLHHPEDLVLAADDRVELLLTSELGEVAAELVQDERPGRRLLALTGRTGSGAFLAPAVTGQELDDLLAHPRKVGAERHENLRGDAFTLTDEAQQQVLGTDVVVPELQRLPQRQLQNLLGAGRERRRAGSSRAGWTDGLLDLLTHCLEGDPERLERLGRDALALVDQPEQDVLGPEEVVVEQPRLFLGEDQDSAGSVGETLEQVPPPIAVGVKASLPTA